ncbi:unnamed protein product [Protopolystoma xenopodis]|uniref:Uncharacterized protein n=1 Tax=Protopolystoma xenopodis TaxID=117903 RepID=A0A448X3N3_9PLAT|nr:unnamed protein product [Protopolystoma xenopodis]
MHTDHFYIFDYLLRPFRLRVFYFELFSYSFLSELFASSTFIKDFYRNLIDVRRRHLLALEAQEQANLTSQFDSKKQHLAERHTREANARSSVSQKGLQQMAKAQKIEQATTLELARTTAKGYKAVRRIFEAPSFQASAARQSYLFMPFLEPVPLPTSAPTPSSSSLISAATSSSGIGSSDQVETRATSDPPGLQHYYPVSDSDINWQASNGQMQTGHLGPPVHCHEHTDGPVNSSPSMKETSKFTAHQGGNHENHQQHRPEIVVDGDSTFSEVFNTPNRSKLVVRMSSGVNGVIDALRPTVASELEIPRTEGMNTISSGNNEGSCTSPDLSKGSLHETDMHASSGASQQAVAALVQLETALQNAESDVVASTTSPGISVTASSIIDSMTQEASPADSFGFRRRGPLMIHQGKRDSSLGLAQTSPRITTSLLPSHLLHGAMVASKSSSVSVAMAPARRWKPANPFLTTLSVS